jgi:hypothetical protein
MYLLRRVKLFDVIRQTGNHGQSLPQTHARRRAATPGWGASCLTVSPRPVKQSYFGRVQPEPLAPLEPPPAPVRKAPAMAGVREVARSCVHAQRSTDCRYPISAK